MHQWNPQLSLKCLWKEGENEAEQMTSSLNQNSFIPSCCAIVLVANERFPCCWNLCAASLSVCSSTDQALRKLTGPRRRKRILCPASRRKFPEVSQELLFSQKSVKSHVTHLCDLSPPHQGGGAKLPLFRRSEGASDRAGLHLHGSKTRISASGSVSLQPISARVLLFCSS